MSQLIRSDQLDWSGSRSQSYRPKGKHGKHWSLYFTRDRVLCRIICPNGEAIQRYGWRYQPISRKQNELADPENAPLLLDDQDIDVETHQIVSIIDYGQDSMF